MNSPIQFPFAFSEATSFAKEDFIISPVNSDAFYYIENYPNWGTGQYGKFLILYGPTHSGKTHLAHIFAQQTQAKFIQTKDLFTKHPSEIVRESNFLILEDLDSLTKYESIIFHLINEVAEQSHYLLITAKNSLIDINFKLPDLNSRLKALPIVAINQPDDQLISTLLTKRFADKQVRISSEIISYIANHIERSFKEINNIIDYIDKKSIIEKKRITLNLVKEVLDYLTTEKIQLSSSINIFDSSTSSKFSSSL